MWLFVFVAVLISCLCYLRFRRDWRSYVSVASIPLSLVIARRDLIDRLLGPLPERLYEALLLLGIIVLVPGVLSLARALIGGTPTSRPPRPDFEVRYAWRRTEGAMSWHPRVLLWLEDDKVQHPGEAMVPRTLSLLGGAPVPRLPREGIRLQALDHYEVSIWNSGGRALTDLQSIIVRLAPGGNGMLPEERCLDEPPKVNAPPGTSVSFAVGDDATSLVGRCDMLNPGERLDVIFYVSRGWRQSQATIEVYVRARDLGKPILCPWPSSGSSVPEPAPLIEERGRAAMWLGRRLHALGKRLVGISLRVGYRSRPAIEAPKDPA